MANRKSKKLPKTLYVAWRPERTDGGGDLFLSVAETAAASGTRRG